MTRVALGGPESGCSDGPLQAPVPDDAFRRQQVPGKPRVEKAETRARHGIIRCSDGIGEPKWGAGHARGGGLLFKRIKGCALC